jgi:transcriptional regulator with XRE-family HTH domain
MITDAEKEGQRLAMFLKAEKLKQVTVAAELNVNKGVFNHYVRGYTRLPPDLCARMHSIYNLNLNWLFTGKGTQKANTPDDKRSLVSDLRDLRSEIQLLIAKNVRQQEVLDKLVRDFYGQKEPQNGHN